jgi:hypothetical protein
MSTTSLPSYGAHQSFEFENTPSYTEHPQAYERRVSLKDDVRPRPSGNFVKVSKNGRVSLRLIAQEDNISLPVYGNAGVVEGTVEISKTDGISSVEVKVRLKVCLKFLLDFGCIVSDRRPAAFTRNCREWDTHLKTLSGQCCSVVKKWNKYYLPTQIVFQLKPTEDIHCRQWYLCS